MLTTILGDELKKLMLAERLAGSDHAQRLPEPGRTKLALERERVAEEYRAHGADWSDEFNRLIYAPSQDELPPETIHSPLTCSCSECTWVRQDTLAGWLLLPRVKLVRRPARAGHLKDMAA